MLNYGSVNPLGAGNLWRYTGGAPPDTINVAPGVTGIKTPLAFEPDFLLQQQDGVYGLDLLGGWVINNANISGTTGMVRAGGNWLVLNSLNDMISGDYTSAINDYSQFQREIGSNLGDTLTEDFTSNSWSLSANGISIFKIEKTGRIYTNQIQAKTPAPHHNYDLPIRDTTGTITGYIRVYQP